MGQCFIAGQIHIHLLNAFLHHRINFRARGKVLITRIGDVTSLGPVTHGYQVDINHRGYFIALVSKGDDFENVDGLELDRATLETLEAVPAPPGEDDVLADESLRVSDLIGSLET